MTDTIITDTPVTETGITNGHAYGRDIADNIAMARQAQQADIEDEAGAEAVADAPAPRRSAGRPSLYSAEMVDEICRRIAEGESLRAICEEPGMPRKATVMRWLQRYPEFRAQYVMAREAQADHLADEIVEIADSAGRLANDPLELAKAKLRIDVRKWLASRLAPRKYGTRIPAEDSEQPFILTLTPDEMALM